MEESERAGGTEFMRVVRRSTARRGKKKSRLKPNESGEDNDACKARRRRYGAGSVLIPTGDFGLDDKERREVLEEIYSSREFSSADSEKNKATVAILSWKERILESKFWDAVKDSIAKCVVGREKGDAVSSLSVLGIGSLFESRISQCQFALCLVLNEFIKPSVCTIFDPILSDEEYELADDLGGFRCENVLEHARMMMGDVDSRERHFYVLLHCDRNLHETIVSRHLHSLEQLCWIGNSLRAYIDADEFSGSTRESDDKKTVLWKVRSKVRETHLIPFKPLWNAFNDTYVVEFAST
eukprot:TRINITY_DN940_c0_g1_i1.p1 TRINITY_DN940_c0_g1~~TRINITY_DN940_c0_g1_i1.p1  ORF type:complete len:297 (+),score=70.65 TRINITY_DN940_c0_g1_i1:217-1107(+)